MAVFTGTGVALVTLFDEAGEGDYAGTARLAVELVERGVRAVVVAGTTGEVDTLDDQERVRLFEAVREAVTGAAVIAGTGAASTRQARSLTASARERGVDAVLARSPRGVADPTDYYEGIAEAARDLPVLGYHFPQVAPPGIPLELLPKLPIQGCKDSSGDMDRLLATLDGWSQPLYVGSSAVLLQAGAMGAAGAILALANSEPELCAAAFGGDARAQSTLTPAHLASLEDFPRGVKRLVADKFGTSTATRVG
jgi:dihydrodipicolinate synthase/N-acetylneuraminate lyase